MKLPISKLIMASAVLLSLVRHQKESSEGIIGKSHPKVENGIMTPEVMYTLGRVGGIEISPDRKKNPLWSNIREHTRKQKQSGTICYGH